MRLFLAIIALPVVYLLPIVLVTQTNMVGFLWLYIIAAAVLAWWGVEIARRRK